jgi:peptidoglycan/LPS O-acetylase OafA/YrhL
MIAAKWAFGFISFVLIGCAAATFVTHPRDGSSFAVPITLGVLGLIAAVISWNAERLFKSRPSDIDGDAVDIALSDHHHPGGGPDD